jgi:hypothetical protein
VTANGYRISFGKILQLDSDDGGATLNILKTNVNA